MQYLELRGPKNSKSDAPPLSSDYINLKLNIPLPFAVIVTLSSKIDPVTPAFLMVDIVVTLEWQIAQNSENFLNFRFF